MPLFHCELGPIQFPLFTLFSLSLSQPTKVFINAPRVRRWNSILFLNLDTFCKMASCSLVHFKWFFKILDLLYLFLSLLYDEESCSTNVWEILYISSAYVALKIQIIFVKAEVKRKGNWMEAEYSFRETRLPSPNSGFFRFFIFVD